MITISVEQLQLNHLLTQHESCTLWRVRILLKESGYVGYGEIILRLCQHPQGVYKAICRFLSEFLTRIMIYREPYSLEGFLRQGTQPIDFAE